MKFNVTYEIITPESAENGDFAEAGFLAEDCNLRDAIEYLGYGAGGLEASDYPVSGSRWITAYRTNDGTDDYYRTGNEENHSLHFPDSMTDASRQRVMRLLGVYGANH